MAATGLAASTDVAVAFMSAPKAMQSSCRERLRQDRVAGASLPPRRDRQKRYTNDTLATQTL